VIRHVGRRPGKSDTRADIVDAARICFAEEGYDRSSLRGIARRAGVDAALVHHYFASKSDLFMATVNLTRDPSDIFDEVNSCSTGKGEALVRAFLSEWEPRPGRAGPCPFVTMVQAVSSSPDTMRALREFLTERVWSRMRIDGQPPGPHLRQALITSQLWGVALSRYVLGLEPLASASIDEVAAWYGPVLQATFDLP
jgi:AcrR family transcriptional regulator